MQDSLNPLKSGNSQCIYTQYTSMVGCVIYPMYEMCHILSKVCILQLRRNGLKTCDFFPTLELVLGSILAAS